MMNSLAHEKGKIGLAAAMAVVLMGLDLYCNDLPAGNNEADWMKMREKREEIVKYKNRLENRVSNKEELT